MKEESNPLNRSGKFINLEGTIIYLHPFDGGFVVGESVIDLTAKENGWPDDEGKIIRIDGSHVLVRYSSGTERWKMHINLKKKE